MPLPQRLAARVTYLCNGCYLQKNNLGYFLRWYKILIVNQTEKFQSSLKNEVLVSKPLLVQGKDLFDFFVQEIISVAARNNFKFNYYCCELDMGTLCSCAFTSLL